MAVCILAPLVSLPLFFCLYTLFYLLSSLPSLCLFALFFFIPFLSFLSSSSSFSSYFILSSFPSTLSIYFSFFLLFSLSSSLFLSSLPVLSSFLASLSLGTPLSPLYSFFSLSSDVFSLSSSRVQSIVFFGGVRRSRYFYHRPLLKNYDFRRPVTRGFSVKNAPWRMLFVVPESPRSPGAQSQIFSTAGDDKKSELLECVKILFLLFHARCTCSTQVIYEGMNFKKQNIVPRHECINSLRARRTLRQQFFSVASSDLASAVLRCARLVFSSLVVIAKRGKRRTLMESNGAECS